MPEWWTYRLQDFLPYSRDTFYRMIERYNQEVWPLHLVAIAVGAALAVLVWRGPSKQPWRDRVVTAALAGAWAWVAWAFHARFFLKINWAAYWFAILFSIEAFLLIWTGLFRGKLSFGPVRTLPGRVGAVMFCFALAGYPLFSLFPGRLWTQAEIFGMSPDPTALATLAVLLLTRGRTHWGLLLIPALWCVVSAAHLRAMGAAEALAPMLAVVLAITFSTVGSIKSKSRG